MNVVVTGSLAFDTIMDFPGRFADRIMPEKIHILSLSFLVDTLTKHMGGSATNLAYTLNLLGVSPLIMSAAGKDFGEIKAFLEQHKIVTHGIGVYTDDFCSSYHVVTDQDDNQIGAFHSGAAKHNKELSLQSLKGLVLSSKARPYENFVTIGPTDPVAMVKYVHECHEFTLGYMYDPAFQIGSFTPEELREGIRGAEILIGNDYEVALIQEKLGISHEELVVMVPILITTLGAKGSIIETRNDSIHIKPAKLIKVIDPTGAGDAYRAGFLAGYTRLAHSRLSLEVGSRLSLLTGEDLVTCGQMGSVAAVYTVESYGTVTHHFTKKEFIKRYKDNYGETISL